MGYGCAIRIAKQQPEALPTTDAIMDALDIPQAQRNVGYSQRISQICRDLGYQVKQTKGKRIWVKRGVVNDPHWFIVRGYWRV